MRQWAINAMYVHFQQILNLLCSYYHARLNERHRQCTDDISGWFETSLNIYFKCLLVRLCHWMLESNTVSIQPFILVSSLPFSCSCAYIVYNQSQVRNITRTGWSQCLSLSFLYLVTYICSTNLRRNNYFAWMDETRYLLTCKIWIQVTHGSK